MLYFSLDMWLCPFLIFFHSDLKYSVTSQKYRDIKYITITFKLQNFYLLLNKLSFYIHEFLLFNKFKLKSKNKNLLILNILGYFTMYSF